MEEQQLLNYQEAADLLKINLGTLYAYTCKGFIPHIRLGPRLVRFSPKALKQWLQDCEQLPTNNSNKIKEN